MAMPTNASFNTGEDALTKALLHMLDEISLAKFKKNAAQFQQTLFQHLLQYQFVSAAALQETCANIFNLPLTLLDQHDESAQKQTTHEMNHHLLILLEKSKNKLCIAIANPDDIQLAKQISFQMGFTVTLKLARYDHLCRLHNATYSHRIYQRMHDTHEPVAQEITHQIIADAIHRGASDIHIEPYQHDLRIRFRIDGLLHEIINMPHSLTDAIISCIKVLSNLDIAIKRIPQNGRMTFRTYLGFFKDCRISTCPTIFNEKIVIRLLDSNTQIRPIENLGLSVKNQQILTKMIHNPQGLILITGPTGSGKTITLYTLLNLLNQAHRNITTIEDPVEIQIEGINQTAINTKTGLTFSQVLRTALRQDPDIMMIGEIRDQETAEMCIRAAHTGHLVLSTLHTNSAAEAIMRLSQMGIAPYQLSSALILVVAQRLVRTLCGFCKTKHAENIDECYMPIGCSNCLDGYTGRLGIFELMPITKAITQLIIEHASHTKIAKQTTQDGHLNLWQAGINAVKAGKTSLTEIYRVISRTDYA